MLGRRSRSCLYNSGEAKRERESERARRTRERHLLSLAPPPLGADRPRGVARERAEPVAQVLGAVRLELRVGRRERAPGEVGERVGRRLERGDAARWGKRGGVSANERGREAGREGDDDAQVHEARRVFRAPLVRRRRVGLRVVGGVSGRGRGREDVAALEVVVPARTHEPRVSVVYNHLVGEERERERERGGNAPLGAALGRRPRAAHLLADNLPRVAVLLHERPQLLLLVARPRARLLLVGLPAHELLRPPVPAARRRAPDGRPDPLPAVAHLDDGRAQALVVLGRPALALGDERVRRRVPRAHVVVDGEERARAQRAPEALPQVVRVGALRRLVGRRALDDEERAEVVGRVAALCAEDGHDGVDRRVLGRRELARRVGRTCARGTSESVLERARTRASEGEKEGTHLPPRPSP